MSEKQTTKPTASVIFVCDKDLKDEFWKICTQNQVNPNSLLRGFMRRAVKDWKDKAPMSTSQNDEPTQTQD